MTRRRHLVRIPGIRRLFRLGARPAAVEADVDDEIAFHFAATVEEMVARGMSREDAEAEARRRFGDVARTRDELVAIDRGVRASDRRADWWDAIRQDLGYALRGLRRSPGLAATVALTLGLGIGANAVMYGIVDRLLLRPPAHIASPDGLHRVYFTRTDERSGRWTTAPTSYARFAVLRDSATSLQDVAAYTVFEDLPLGRGAEARDAAIGAVSAEFFPLLGTRPALGRFFLPEEDRPPEGAHVAVLGWGTWQRDFGGDDNVLGREVEINGEPFTIVGVAPRGFTGVELEAVDVWAPLAALARFRTGPRWYLDKSSIWLSLVARPRPGAGIERASQEATLLERRLPVVRSFTDSTITVTFGPVTGLRELDGSRTKESRVAIWLAGVSLAVLLIACANVSNLLLARALQRRREIAVRIALGIGRRRLAGQLLAESLVLALLGGAAAVLVAVWGGGALRSLLLPNVAWDQPVISGRVLAFTALAAVTVGLVTGLFPAIGASRPDVSAALGQAGRRSAPARARTRVALLVAQAALSTALLVGAGLFVRSLRNVRGLDLGLDVGRLLVVSVHEGYDAAMDRAFSHDTVPDDFLQPALERVAALPGVADASLAMGVPFRWSFGGIILRPGQTETPSLSTGIPYYNAVSPGFFTTTGTRILLGRGFLASDDRGSTRVVVLNETLARVLFDDPPAALGRCVHVLRDSTCATVVGVVEDARRGSIREDPTMQFYLPLAQWPGEARASVVLARTAGDRRNAARAIRRALLDLYPTAVAVDVTPLAEALDPQIRPWRLGASMFGIFGLLALAVAAVGLYGVVAYSVVQRTHEMGIRRALGATSGDVARLVVGEGVRVTTAGVLLGAALALLAARFVEPLLFDVSPRDPWTYAAAALTLLAVALAASALPAMRATRVDPRIALQAD